MNLVWGFRGNKGCTTYDCPSASISTRDSIYTPWLGAPWLVLTAFFFFLKEHLTFDSFNCLFLWLPLFQLSGMPFNEILYHDIKLRESFSLKLFSLQLVKWYRVLVCLKKYFFFGEDAMHTYRHSWILLCTMALIYAKMPAQHGDDICICMKSRPFLNQSKQRYLQSYLT